VYSLRFTKEAKASLQELKDNESQHKVKKVVEKSLGLLQLNPRHPSLATHEFRSMSGPKREKIWEAYAQNHTPGAWRIFFYYCSEPKQIMIVAITPHP
jgi:hypothetical protein